LNNEIFTPNLTQRNKHTKISLNSKNSNKNSPNHSNVKIVEARIHWKSTKLYKKTLQFTGVQTIKKLKKANDLFPNCASQLIVSQQTTAIIPSFRFIWNFLRNLHINFSTHEIQGFCINFLKAKISGCLCKIPWCLNYVKKRQKTTHHHLRGIMKEREYIESASFDQLLFEHHVYSDYISEIVNC
jgi:hypothetical protein